MKTLHGEDSLGLDLSTLTETETAVFEILKSRWATGRSRYGVGITYKQHGSPIDWLDEAIEECADQLQYLVALKISLEKEKSP